MGIIPAPLITAPEPTRRRRFGLLDSANGPLDLPQRGRGGGLRYVPTACGHAYAYGINCYGGEVEAPEKPRDADNSDTETGVFAVLATLECTQVGQTEQELRDKVLRRLANGEASTVEAAFWTGLDFEGNPLAIANLDQAAEPVTVPDDESIALVVAALERYAYVDEDYGHQAYLHAPVEVAALAAEANLLIADGPRWVTPLGSVWVFGAYPAGEVIITGQVTLWRSPEVTVNSAFDTATNTRLLVAEREWAASFDCLAGRAPFNPLGIS